MSYLGRTVTAMKLKYKHGLSTVYYRDFERKKILKTKPASTNDKSVEIHVLTSSNDYLNMIWALKSFYFYSGKQYSLCIHDDGTLLDSDKHLLLDNFPNARLITRIQAEEEVLPGLQDHLLCHQFRQQNHLAPKLFDFIHFLQADRMLLLDSDVLFFSNPLELINRLEDPTYKYNTVNADVQSAYTVNRADVQKQFGFSLIEKFNSGLGLIHKGSIQKDWIESFLRLPGILGHFWRIEQTLFALCSSRFGVELLPENYDVYLEGKKPQVQSRHYVGAVRHLMYKEGIQRLVRQGFLKAIS